VGRVTGPRPESCRAILASWRSSPSFDFGERYARVAVMARAAAAGGATRLVDGIVVRVGRGDAEEAIIAWAEAFAARRGIPL
jgi:hypothetical protein